MTQEEHELKEAKERSAAAREALKAGEKRLAELEAMIPPDPVNLREHLARVVLPSFAEAKAEVATLEALPEVSMQQFLALENARRRMRHFDVLRSDVEAKIADITREIASLHKQILWQTGENFRFWTAKDEDQSVINRIAGRQRDEEENPYGFVSVPHAGAGRPAASYGALDLPIGNGE